MERLTRKLINEKGYRASNDDSGLDFDPMTNELIGGNLIQKLGQLEDIEQELGIDLITLFKALKQGYVWYGSKGELYKYEIECVYIKPIIHLYVADGVGECCFKDYGKTWALTKGELK